jgi:hypothetical protein
MTTIIQNTKNLALQLTHAESLRDGSAKLLESLTAKDFDIAQAIQTKRTELENASASAAIGGPDSADPRQALADAQTALNVAIQAQDQHTLTKAGLGRKLANEAAEIARLKDLLKAAREAAILEKLAAADADYVKHATQTDLALKRVIACRMALYAEGARGSFTGTLEPIEFVAVGPVSTKAAEAVSPSLGGGFGRRFLPRQNAAKDCAALIAELL